MILPASAGQSFSDDKYEEMQNFSKFVDWVAGLDIEAADIHLRAQSALIDLENCDYLGRMETFEDDLGNIFQCIGLPNKSRKNRNLSSERKRYQDYYTDEVMIRVGKIYEKDIQFFNYRFDG